MEGAKSISSLVLQVLPDSADPLSDDFTQKQLKARWMEVAGNAGIYSFPIMFQSGRVVIFTDSSIWANDIRARSSSLKEDLIAYLPQITSLEIKNRPVQASAPSKSGFTPEMSRTQGKNITATTSRINHPGLKTAMLKLAKRAED